MSLFGGYFLVGLYEGTYLQAFRSLEAGRWLPTADFLLPEWKTAITVCASLV